MLLKKMLYKHVVSFLQTNIRKISNTTIATVCAVHFMTSYFAFLLSGEGGLTGSMVDYLYYWVVTSSTVGYGDLSPVTPAGKLIVAFYFIPFSLVMFTVIVAKAGDYITTKIRRYMMGHKSFSDLENHIVIVGYHTKRTKEIVELILADKKRERRTILIVTKENILHPFLETDGVEYCNVESYSDAASLEKIAISKACKVIIDGLNDGDNFAHAVHFKNKVNDKCHITTYISDEDKATTLRELNGNIEVVTPKVAEQLVRTMQDNGTSMTFHQLLTSGYGQTVYVSDLKVGKVGEITVHVLENYLRAKYSAKFLGYSTNDDSGSLKINPPLTEVVKSGSRIHYISDERINEIDCG